MFLRALQVLKCFEALCSFLKQFAAPEELQFLKCLEVCQQVNLCERVLAGTTHFGGKLQRPANTCKHLQTPANTCKHLQRPAKTCKDLQRPAKSFKGCKTLQNTATRCKHPKPKMPAWLKVFASATTRMERAPRDAALCQAEPRLRLSIALSCFETLSNGK